MKSVEYIYRSLVELICKKILNTFDKSDCSHAAKDKIDLIRRSTKSRAKSIEPENVHLEVKSILPGMDSCAITICMTCTPVQINVTNRMGLSAQSNHCQGTFSEYPKRRNVARSQTAAPDAILQLNIRRNLACSVKYHFNCMGEGFQNESICKMFSCCAFIPGCLFL